MSPADRLDALLRAELHRADDLPVDNRYDAVLARSAQRTRRLRAAMAAGALAAVGVVAGTGITVLDRDPAPSPVVPTPDQHLDGTWSRTIDGQRWTITFDAAAVLRISAPAGAPEGVDGASYDATSSTVRLDTFANGACAEMTPGTYRWTLTGSDLLRLQAGDEPCDVRRDVFDGTWTASP